MSTEKKHKKKSLLPITSQHIDTVTKKRVKHRVFIPTMTKNILV